MIIDRQKKVRRDGKTEIAVSGLLRRKERNKLRGNETRIKREKERGGEGAGKRVQRKDSLAATLIPRE